MLGVAWFACLDRPNKWATSGELAGRPYLRAHGGPWAAREGGSGTKRVAPDTHELGVAGYGAGVGCGGRS